MAELSQSDLDALFADISLDAAPQQDAEPSGLDKLMADLAALGVDTTPEEPKAAPVDSASGSESLSQDEIDALLKEFLG